MQTRPRIDEYTIGVRPRENIQWTDEKLRRVYTLRTKEHRTAAEIGKLVGASKTEIYNALRRMYRAINGECGRCGKPLNEEDRLRIQGRLTSVLCPTCSPRTSQYKKMLRDEALAHGLCGYCHKKPVLPGLTGCRGCLSATHRRRNLKGLCGICGTKPIRKKGKMLCTSCAKILANKAWARRKEA